MGENGSISNKVALSPSQATKKPTVVVEIENKLTLQSIRNVSFTLTLLLVLAALLIFFFGVSLLCLSEIIYIWLTR